LRLLYALYPLLPWDWNSDYSTLYSIFHVWFPNYRLHTPHQKFSMYMAALCSSSIWLTLLLRVARPYRFLFAGLPIISTLIIDQQVKWIAVVNDFCAFTVLLYLCSRKYLLDVLLELPVVCPLFHLFFHRFFCCVESVLQIFMYPITFYTLYMFEEPHCKFVLC